MVNTNDSWYQYPNKTDSESLLNLFGYVNNQVSGIFFPVILGVVWFIAFVSVFSATGGGRDSASRAFSFASFFSSILAIPLTIGGLLSTKIMFLFFILTGVGALWMKLGASTVD